MVLTIQKTVPEFSELKNNRIEIQDFVKIDCYSKLMHIHKTAQQELSLLSSKITVLFFQRWNISFWRTWFTLPYISVSDETSEISDQEILNYKRYILRQSKKPNIDSGICRLNLFHRRPVYLILLKFYYLLR